MLWLQRVQQAWLAHPPAPGIASMPWEQLAPLVLRANEQGRSVWGKTSPNPPVGAVVFDPRTGSVLGEGATQPPGGAHAEVAAIAAAGARARGAALLVTLEPCNHTGRTGPCSEAILQAGIHHVIVLAKEPTAQAGGGAARLSAAGVDVVCLDTVVPSIQPWCGAMLRGRPWVSWKTAVTLDGKTAAEDGSSQWITSAAARAQVHQDRRGRDAIMVGRNTAVVDDPRLSARDSNGQDFPEQPIPVVIGSAPLPATSKLHQRGYQHYNSPQQALQALFEQGVRNIVLEGGAGLGTSMLEQGLVDQIQAYIAPAVLGSGRGMLSHGLGTNIADLFRGEYSMVDTIGADIYCVVDVAETTNFADAVAHNPHSTPK